MIIRSKEKLEQDKPEIKFKRDYLVQAKPKATRYTISDEGTTKSVQGLMLEVLPSRKKVFRFRKLVNGERPNLHIGDFPMITIEKAREIAATKYHELLKGVNPNTAKKEQKEASVLECQDSQTVQD
ncbi:Arm DNA-binding domain-containing protein [Paraferrimonas sp. SM1919]|uniref:Arm DNA-binding domain-containing protein n=1 Tax=Paraferrimonas sp. SM1919 TaxID=2662263 RepID=UPI0013D3BB5C|nr:Arm DNA-binding domain-containing protein [Paraferrimonas sp. SM1919]